MRARPQANVPGAESVHLSRAPVPLLDLRTPHYRAAFYHGREGVYACGVRTYFFLWAIVYAIVWTDVFSAVKILACMMIACTVTV